MLSLVDGVGKVASLSHLEQKTEGERTGTAYVSCSSQKLWHALTSSRPMVFCAHFKSVYILPNVHFLLKIFRIHFLNAWPLLGTHITCSVTFTSNFSILILIHHSNTHICTDNLYHTYTNIHTNTCAHTEIYTHTHVHTQKYTRIHTQIHMLICTHKCIHKHIHTLFPKTRVYIAYVYWCLEDYLD